MSRFALAAAGLLLFLMTACVQNTALRDAAAAHANAETLAFTKTLSSDALQGRGVGTPGNQEARRLILDQFEALGLAPMPGSKSFQQAFKLSDFADRATGKPRLSNTQGVNLIAVLEGSGGGDAPILVITAHYDHLGIRDGDIYNGADDNASGVAGMLTIAKYFVANPPESTIWFVAFDAEEHGLRGARHFVRTLPSELEPRIGLNLNLDMISRGDNDLLWASGTAHWPSLRNLVRSVATTAPVTLKMGFDTGDGYDNWTELSDHAAFYQAGIPHLYLGVEDHPDYHKPSDDFARINPDWFLKSVTTSIMIAAKLEAQLPKLHALRGR